MITSFNTIGIIADDLTGANDTALQFKLNGADTNILLNKDIEPKLGSHEQAWAISTESRNITPEEAFEKVKAATEVFAENLIRIIFIRK